MLGFVRNWFSAKASPIGVDLGTDTLRLAQCIHDGREWRLHAAACMDVPQHARQSQETLNDFLGEAIRELVHQGRFSGRDAILCVPSPLMHLQHIRMPPLGEAEIKKALPWEVKGKLPLDPAHAVLRHIVAGDVQVNNEPRQEVIVLATSKSTVSQMLAVAGKAKLNVIGMNVEPRAIVDCFTHVYRRKQDGEVTTCYVDLGCRTTRVVIARGQQILFARAIEIGGDTLTNAVAKAMGISFEQAKLLRIKLASQPIARPAPKPAEPELPTDAAAETPSENNSFALLNLAPATERRQTNDDVDIVPPTLPPDEQEQAARVDAACAGVVQQLCDELNLCRRYHEATFAQAPVDRIVFVGGEARQRGMCQRIAQTLGVAAQLGDPLIRMAKTTDIGPESGIDLKQPQPAWAVALGLSMGPRTGEQVQSKSA